MASSSLSERIRRLIRLARTSRPSVETKQQAQQQVEYLGKAAESIVVFPYGLHAAAPADTLAVLLAQLGNPEALLHMPALVPLAGRPAIPPSPGDVVLYSPVSKAEVRVTAAGAVVVTVGSTIFNLSAAGVVITGDVTITGNVATVGTITNNGTDIGSGHAHVGSPTAPTGAISNTGAPI